MVSIKTSLLLIVVFCLTWFVQDTIGASCEFKKSSNGTVSGSCGECVGYDIECFYCDSTKKCEKRTSVIVNKDQCSGKWYTYSQCTIPGVVLIVIAPLAAVLLLVFLCCCVYCICCRDCCRERSQRKWAKEDSKRENRKNERDAKHAARDEERKLKHDQIRAKYGLFKDDSNKYQKFDTDP
ncbi:pituitary tumor-transforming gene 1 protein-interacting protein-like [Clytia hemisphaerica]|uniref:Pituitary tumor-transforming gene 1 protein-interacting protein n=1 Tax=Clytia hemisphaerica TaxID=252671 RepID=A0A7M5WW73_9CNID|eukprot:TCONS_00011953-protein